jgi:hypothetical protein
MESFTHTELSHNVSSPTVLLESQRLRDQAIVLRVVEVFLTQVEMSLLISAGSAFDYQGLKRQIDALRDGPPNEALAELIATNIAGWRERLTERDQAIEAYHMRRFCDGLKVAVDKEIMLAMARFYLEQPYSRNSLSKFDLVLTRAFSSKVGDFRHCLQADRETMTETLTGRFERWGRPVAQGPAVERAVSTFDEFVEECFSIEGFDQFSASRIFERLREFKSSLGDMFFAPSIAAVAVECNIALGNRLNVLISEAARDLGERLGSEFDIAGALHDTSPNAGVYIKEILRELDEIGSSEPEAEEDMGVVRSVLDLAPADDVSFDPTNVPMPVCLRD